MSDLRTNLNKSVNSKTMHFPTTGIIDPDRAIIKWRDDDRDPAPSDSGSKESGAHIHSAPFA
jgi:hypothetical protein